MVFVDWQGAKRMGAFMDIYLGSDTFYSFLSVFRKKCFELPEPFSYNCVSGHAVSPHRVLSNGRNSTGFSCTNVFGLLSRDMRW